MEFPPIESTRPTLPSPAPDRANRLAAAFAAALPSNSWRWRDLQNALHDYVRAEKRAGRAPEEVLVRIKELLQEGGHLAMQDRARRPEELMQDMEALKNRLVRACIDAYYADE